LGGIVLHQMRPDLEDFFTAKTRGMGDRAAGHDDAARGDRSHPEWRQRGVAVAHGYLRGIDAELLVRDLSERGLEALPVRLNPHREDERAVRHELRGAAFVARNERTAAADPFATAVAGLFRIAGKGHTHHPAIRLALALPRAHRVTHA